jgi:hypothetical protein
LVRSEQLVGLIQGDDVTFGMSPSLARRFNQDIFLECTRALGFVAKFEAEVVFLKSRFYEDGRFHNFAARALIGSMTSEKGPSFGPIQLLAMASRWAPTWGDPMRSLYWDVLLSVNEALPRVSVDEFVTKMSDPAVIAAILRAARKVPQGSEEILALTEKIREGTGRLTDIDVELLARVQNVAAAHLPARSLWRAGTEVKWRDALDDLISDPTYERSVVQYVGAITTEGDDEPIEVAEGDR